MNQEEAVALAAKREKHKSKSLANKKWAAQHTPEKGWHVALIDDQNFIANEARKKAQNALRFGDLNGFIEAAGESMLARARAEIELHEQ